MVEESLIPSVLCMSGRVSQNGHTTQERVKRTRIVQPARKKSSAKTISCLRNCWRCRLVLPVRGLHSPRASAALRASIACARSACDALNRLWPPPLPVTLGVPAAADVSRRSGCCEGWRG